MATIKVKNAAGAWESVAMASGGIELAHAAVTYYEASTSTKKFDISNYIPASGTIYVLYSYNSFYYTAVITDGVMVSNQLCMDGNFFAGNSTNTYPNTVLGQGNILNVKGSTAANVANTVTVIYMA